MSNSPTPALPIQIAEWKRNSREAIRVQLANFKGQAVIDVRCWYVGPDGTLRPGRGGLTLAVRHLPDLATAMATAMAEALRLELLARKD